MVGPMWYTEKWFLLACSVHTQGKQNSAVMGGHNY